MTKSLLRIEGLRTVFRSSVGDIPAVDGVTLDVPRGRTLGIVGESGCGKSMLSLSVMRLVPPPGRVAAGRVLFDGQDLLEHVPFAMAHFTHSNLLFFEHLYPSKRFRLYG